MPPAVVPAVGTRATEELCAAKVAVVPVGSVKNKAVFGRGRTALDLREAFVLFLAQNAPGVLATMMTITAVPVHPATGVPNPR
ncbi:hypothetical protein GTO10_05885 [Candidatus Saccharibacteria bacterium]|nr:hypothetical protein [Candidatus Saccharibacteria bacterium]